MSVQRIKFYEDLVDDIRRGEKFQTIRYNWNAYPEVGDEINAISTHEGDIFAHIRVTDLEILSLNKCANRDLEGHKNYASAEDLLEDMNNYYGDISISDDVILVTFEVTEWIR